MEENLVVHGQKPTGPIVGEWFEVNPYTINRELFEEEREDDEQEKVRQNILAALLKFSIRRQEMRYIFGTMRPNLNYNNPVNAEDLYHYAHYEFGAYEKKDEEQSLYEYDLANEDEQACELAKRIQNGESWEDICNKAENSNCRRLVEKMPRNIDSNDEGDCAFFVIYGGSHINPHPAGFKDDNTLRIENSFVDIVPLIVRLRKI